ncbi:MAG: hypothetical protein ABF391_07590, partial [Akkermansiaceae bacterium]
TTPLEHNQNEQAGQNKHRKLYLGRHSSPECSNSSTSSAKLQIIRPAGSCARQNLSVRWFIG